MNNKILNKNDFVEYIKSNTGEFKTKAEVERAVEAVLLGVTGALSEGYKVNFIGFGSFEVKKVKARSGRNPKNGKPIEIKEHNRPGFRAGTKLKNSVNEILPTPKTSSTKKK